MTEIIATFMHDGRFLPAKRYEKVCAEQFVVGERYVVDVGSMQSAAKRAMFHATLREIYASLPDDLAERWLSYDHFRYYLTIKSGFADESQEICETKAEAERYARRVRAREPYSLVTIKDNVVTIWTARSTKHHMMKGDEFSALVDAVLGKAADLIGVEPKALRELHKVHKDRPDKQANEVPAIGPVTTPERAQPQGTATAPMHNPAEGLRSPPTRQREGMREYRAEDRADAAQAKAITELRDGSRAPPVSEAQAPESSSAPTPGSVAPSGAGPGERRRLTLAEAVAMVPLARTVKTAVRRADGNVAVSEWSFDECHYDLEHAKIIALTDTVPGYPLGVQDPNGRVVYFEIRGPK